MIERTLPFCKNPAGLFSSLVISTCREVQGGVRTAAAAWVLHGHSSTTPAALILQFSLVDAADDGMFPGQVIRDLKLSIIICRARDPKPNSAVMPNSAPGTQLGPWRPSHIEDREADGPGASNPSVSPNQSRLYRTPPAARALQKMCSRKDKLGRTINIKQYQVKHIIYLFMRQALLPCASAAGTRT